MRCFQHRTEDAVGVCRGCGKAVCPRCTIDTGEGLACSEGCKARVRDDRALVARTRFNLSRADRIKLVLGWIIAVPSGMFAIMSLMAGDPLAALSWLPSTAGGILFMAWSRSSERQRKALTGERQGSLPERPPA